MIRQLFTLLLWLTISIMPIDEARAVDQHTSAGTMFPTEQELQHDFGFVGIDFVVQHLYPFVNRGSVPIRITDARPSCLCTSVYPLDSLAMPGDTIYIRARFDSKDFYGVIKKTFTVFTDQPEMSEIEYSFTSVVGHWVDGLKPEPISLFFLPKQKSKKLTIMNPRFARVELLHADQYDDTFVTTTITKAARMGEALEIEVTPRENLSEGTFMSNLSLTISKEGYERPTIITIPVKIVRY